MSSTKSRKDTRAVVSLVARYRSPATFEYVQEACCDVSVGGMFIKSQDPAAAGTLLKLECEADESEKIRGVGRVVWLRREPNEHGPAGMGVKFVKLEAGSKELITELVKRLAEAGIEPRNISAPPETAAAARRAPEIVQPASFSPGSIPSGGALRSSIPTASRSPAPSALGASVSRSPVPATASTRSSIPSVSRTAPPAVSAPSNGAGSAEPASAKLSGATAVSPPPERASAAPAEAVAASSEQSATQTSVASHSATTVASSAADSPAKPSESETDAAPRLPSVISEPPPPVRRSALRIWLGIVIGVAVLLAIIFADDSTGSSPGPAATSGKPTTSAPSQLSAPPTPPPTAAEPSAAEPSAADSPNSSASSASSPADPSSAHVEPAEQPSTPPPAAAAAPATSPQPQPTTAQPAAAATDAPIANKGGFVMEFISRPTGATVTVGDRSVVTPGQLEFGSDMPPRVKVIAKKPGFQQSSAWIDHTGFENINGALVRRVTMILPVEAAVPPPPAAPAHPH